MALKIAVLLQLMRLIILLAPALVKAYDRETLEYLQQFGYLPKPDPRVAAMAVRSETMVEEAIRELQLYGKIPVTGKVDSATRKLMSRKRCGLSDRPWQYSQRILRRSRRHRHQKRYALMGMKWNKRYVTYSVDNPSRSIPDLGTVRREIIEAIGAWQRIMPVQFREVRPEAGADIRIRFAVGDHGDAYSFDGTGRVLAHAFAPGEGIGGDVHLDDDEHWTVALTGDPYNHQVSLRSIAMHELGHSMGLSHSQQEDSIMYAYYQYDLPPRLSYDDVSAIRMLYGNGYVADPRVPPPPVPTPRPQPPQRPLSPEEPVLPTTHPDSSSEPPTLEPDPCTSSYDAIAAIRQEIFVFKDGWFWRIRQDGTSLIQGPRQISSLWKEVVWPIDGAVESDHRIYLFAGKHVYIFDGQRLISKKALTELGLPSSVDRIRLVYTWNYWTEKPMYIWTREDFWRVDKRSGKVEIGYPRKIASTWHGIPESASAALTYNNALYFFDDNNRAYKFYTINMTAAPPISTSQLWRFCPIAMKISCASDSLYKHPSQRLLFSLLPSFSLLLLLLLSTLSL